MILLYLLSHCLLKSLHSIIIYLLLTSASSGYSHSHDLCYSGATSAHSLPLCPPLLLEYLFSAWFSLPLISSRNQQEHDGTQYPAYCQSPSWAPTYPSLNWAFCSPRLSLLSASHSSYRSSCLLFSAASSTQCHFWDLGFHFWGLFALSRICQPLTAART